MAEDFLQVQEIFCSPEFPAGIESHSTCYSIGKGGLSSGIKRSARESNHVHLMSRFKNSGSYCLLLHVLSEGAKRQLYFRILQKENNTNKVNLNV